MVRFRTLGCYPLTGAVESTATTFRESSARRCGATSRAPRPQRSTKTAAASMERKKQEGYF